MNYISTNNNSIYPENKLKTEITVIKVILVVMLEIIVVVLILKKISETKIEFVIKIITIIIK